MSIGGIIWQNFNLWGARVSFANFGYAFKNSDLYIIFTYQCIVVTSQAHCSPLQTKVRLCKEETLIHLSGPKVSNNALGNRPNVVQNVVQYYVDFNITLVAGTACVSLLNGQKA